MLESNQQKNLSRVIARAWADPSFKEQLRASPQRVLTEMGVSMPIGVDIELVENTDAKIYFVLPTPPSREAGLDEDLDMADCGQGCHTGTCGSNVSCQGGTSLI